MTNAMHPTPAPDAKAFRRAVDHLRAGDAEAAERVIEGLVDAAPDHPEVLHLAGVIAFERGEAERGEVRLRRAAALAPENAEIPYNHGSALLRAGAAAAAAERFEACLALAPGHTSARNNLGTVLRELGRTREAAAAFRAVLAARPDHVGAHVNLGQLELAAGNPAAALGHFEQATRRDPGRLNAWLGLAEALLAAERSRAAIPALERAVALAPGAAEAWRLLARARLEAGDFEGALAAARRVVELEPDSPDAWNNLGNAWTSFGALAPAEEALNRALALAPEHREARINRAVLLELANRPAEALTIARPDSGEPRLELVRARCLARDGALDEARTLLGGLRCAEDPWLRKEACFTAGRLADRAGDVEAAWDAFTEGNRIAGELWFRGDPPRDGFVPGLAGIAAMLEQPGAWERVAGPARRDSPAFLFGFQRSGTTLLDTVLGVHERVRVMEEQPVLNRVITRMGEAYAPYPAGVPRLDAAAREDLRRVYREETDRRIEGRAGALVLDKAPLHTVHLALIHRLFPEAPLVLALRHPLDVCLSCYMQDFTLNPFMTHFLTVAGVARVYRAVFDLWFRSAEALADRVHVVRYETLVDAPERELRALVNHLGIGWDDRLLDHTGAARDRGLINTPSYDQVSQPIYRSARFRWERYRPYLRDVEESLAPYIERLGYAAR